MEVLHLNQACIANFAVFFGSGNNTMTREFEPQVKPGIKPYSLNVPPVRDPGAHTASHVPAHPSPGQYLHPMNVRSSFHVLKISCRGLLLKPQARLTDRSIKINASSATGMY